jgi:CheY-like chemotaxis protein
VSSQWRLDGGHAVQVAYSAADALQALDGFAPAVVISEVVLPHKNGCDLARLLRQRDREVLLVALTGLGRDADRDRCREAGFDLHFTKPADPLELQKVLRQKATAGGPFVEQSSANPIG